MRKYIISFAMLLCMPLSMGAKSSKAEGYRGIWYSLNQFSEYGDKYSGGLGTYTADHTPTAVYAKKAKKTFFLYGGTTKADERHLQVCIGAYNHKTGKVTRPVIVCDKKGVDDPHDNGSICITPDGHIWVFVSGRNVTRKGQIFRSVKPYDINDFEEVYKGVFTYPQPYYVEGKGFILLYTMYTAPNTRGRELYFSTSKDGREWTEAKKIGAIEGHYQISVQDGQRIITAFNYHPRSSADTRTNLYVMQTTDMGKTWKNIKGDVLSTPLNEPYNPALVRDTKKEDKLLYLNDINIDKDGNPAVLAIKSSHYQPGPKGNPREWILYRYNGKTWTEQTICTSTHNYDMGSLYINGNELNIIGPTEPGPQYYGTGGEMALWNSRDNGISWEKVRNITGNSDSNHSYARRPLFARNDFYAFWADGNSNHITPSYLYFCNKEGNKLWRLPYTMEDDEVMPERVSMEDNNQGWINKALTSALKQSEILLSEIEAKGEGVFPRSVDMNGKLMLSDASWWCSGFFPGVLWQLYEATNSKRMHDGALRLTLQLASQQYNKTTHDLGFMMYCSYGQAYKYHTTKHIRQVLVNAAYSLSSRFNGNVGCIQSWEPWNWWQFPVIIDNMMNLELLMWAANETGDTNLRDIAIRHADTTMKNHFRDDLSSYHVVSYKKNSGEVEFQGTNQGASDSSAWARGQAWGLYGYTMMYRFTHDKKYLYMAQGIAKFMINHPNMPKDYIPYWDFSRHDYRDSSSAAIMASALLELASYSDECDAQEFINIAIKQLKNLSSGKYLARHGAQHGFILKHGVGNYPINSEIDAPLSYGDYYYIEALIRLKKKR